MLNLYVFSLNIINSLKNQVSVTKFLYNLYHCFVLCLKTKSDTDPPDSNSLAHKWLLFFSHWVMLRLFAIPWTAAHQASLSFTSSQNLLKLMSIESVMPSNHFILCHPFLLLPSVISNESALCIRWPKYWSFSFNIVLPVNIQNWFPLGLTGLISWLSKDLSRVFLSTTIWKHQSFFS